jgi:hypothetical protein
MNGSNKQNARRIHSDLEGNIAERQDDDELCLMLSDLTRVSLLKFFDKMSRNDMTDRGLNDAEILALRQFRHSLD